MRSLHKYFSSTQSIPWHSSHVTLMSHIHKAGRTWSLLLLPIIIFETQTWITLLRSFTTHASWKDLRRYYSRIYKILSTRLDYHESSSYSWLPVMTVVVVKREEQPARTFDTKLFILVQDGDSSHLRESPCNLIYNAPADGLSSNVEYRILTPTTRNLQTSRSTGGWFRLASEIIDVSKKAELSFVRCPGLKDSYGSWPAARVLTRQLHCAGIYHNLHISAHT